MPQVGAEGQNLGHLKNVLCCFLACLYEEQGELL